MRLSTDPDTLRIPAFMRKKSIRSKGKFLVPSKGAKEYSPNTPSFIKPKKISPPKPAKKAQSRAAQRPARRPVKAPELFSPTLFAEQSFVEPIIEAPRRTHPKAIKIPKVPKPPKSIKMPKAPKIKVPKIKEEKPKLVGKITHYYAKINVGVIDLAGPLEVGDCVTYSTSDGPYEHLVDSMEIDRKPVFKARKGATIGIKLGKAPSDNSPVFKIKKKIIA